MDVYILADLLDIRDDQWRNAVEGYLGGNKLNLVVAPKYAKIALGIYRELDKKSSGIQRSWIQKGLLNTAMRR